MSQKEIKDIRKQLKNILQEVGPEVLAAEAMKLLEERLDKKLNARLEAIHEHINSVLAQVDERSKTVTSHLLRSTSSLSPVTNKQ